MSESPAQPAPRLIVHRARIYTMDETQPVASAIVAVDGVIVAIGGEELLATADDATEVVDAAGAAIVPGLIDAHNHHLVAGEADLFRLSFSDSADIDGICAAVRAWIEEQGLAPGEWVVGGNWGSTLAPALSEPDALARLDAVSPRNPVLLVDDSHHNRWANSAALALAGITAETPDPAGGRIVRDASGAPTGLLFESAGALLEQTKAATEHTGVERLARCSERGMEMMHELGITAFQDASGSLPMLQAMKLLDDEGRLKSWAVTSMLINDNIFGTEILGEELMERGAEYRTVHHLPSYTKIFLDGIPPTRTAAFLEPYLPDDEHGHDHLGVTTMPLEELEGWLRTADSYGLGVKVHCTGDASVRMVLDAVERVRVDGVQTPVHIGHGQYVHPDDVPRFAKLGVFAEISPALWFPSLIIEAIRTVLPQPLVDHVHPNRDLIDAGAVVVAGSDWPVSESPNPWHAIYGLVTRKNPAGSPDDALWPGQAITREEALRAYTASSAQALGIADTAGRLAPGLSADFVRLSADPFAVPVEELKDIVAEETWFAGERVFSRG